jgi:hypothetical protein
MSDSIPHWLLLHYKLPAQPSASRVYVWRKLKRLGAVRWLDAAWVLPDTPHTREQFQWLSAEIVELQGEAATWLAQNLVSEQEAQLIRQFTTQVDVTYQQLMAHLKKRNPDLAAVSRQYQQTKQADYFQSGLGQQVREQLVTRRGGQSA